jgi:hypothetical protein
MTTDSFQAIVWFCSVMDAPARFRDPGIRPPCVPNPHDPAACTNSVLPATRFYRIALADNSQ